MSVTLKIGALAAATGTTTPTIRFYEEIGLLPAASRQTSGQRRYGSEDVKRLTFIRRCREFGFSVEQVRALVSVIQDPSRSCTEVRDIAHAHLDTVRAKLAELRALERDIVRFVERCDGECVGGPGPSCVPLTELSREGTLPRSSRQRPARAHVRNATARAGRRA
jgi:DNA-binding transcriptional MerR regulator